MTSPSTPVRKTLLPHEKDHVAQVESTMQQVRRQKCGSADWENLLKQISGLGRKRK